MTCIMFALCQSVRCQDFYLSARILVHLQFQSLLSALFTHGTLPWALAPPTILLRFLRSMIWLFIPCVLHCIRASVPWARAPLPLSDCRGGKRGAPGWPVATSPMPLPPNGVARQCPNCSGVGVAHHGAQERKEHLAACGRASVLRTCARSMHAPTGLKRLGLQGTSWPPFSG